MQEKITPPGTRVPQYFPPLCAPRILPNFTTETGNHREEISNINPLSLVKFNNAGLQRLLFSGKVVVAQKNTVKLYCQNFRRGCSSVVEHHVANVRVVSSSLITR